MLQKNSFVGLYSGIIMTFLILSIIDYSGDLHLGQRGQINIYQLIEDLIRQGIAVSLIIIGILGFLNIFPIKKIKSSGVLCIACTFLVLIYALVNGILSNNLDHVIRESLPAIVLMLIPLLIKIDAIQRHKLGIFFLYLLVIIAAIKILIIQFVAINIYGSLSWKVLLRLSPVLILPYCYFLLNILRGQASRLDFLYLLVVIVEILIANARALNLILLIATFIIIFTSNISYKLLTIICIFAISAGFSIIATNGSIENVFGIWTGEHLENTVNHRLIQLDVILNRLSDNPIFGFGLGYFTPGYDSYADLALPYLLELDLLNFFTKVGIPMSILYVFSYFLIIFQHIKNRYHGSNIEYSYLLSLILLLVYSLFQTAHSSFIFWLLYAFTFSFIFRKA
jgi:hypothetical protein